MRMNCWDVYKIGELCDVITGSTPSRTNSEYWNEGSVPWFTVDDIRKGGRVIHNTIQHVTEKAVKESSLRLMPADTVLLCCTASVGEYAITRVPITSNQQFNGLVIKSEFKDKLSADFLFNVASTLKEKLKAFCGKTSVDFVSGSNLKSIQIPLPPIDEQRKIAEILRTWDEAIEAAEAELKAKQERKRWLMTVVMRKSYETKSVSQFGTLKKGGAILREKLRSEGVPVVLYGDIYTKYSEIVTRLISRVDASAVVDGVKLNSGDIVFAGSGETAEEIGKCIAYVGEEAAYAGGDVVILCNHGQDPRYLGYALNSEDAIRQKMRLGQGSSVMHLYKDDVASIKIPLPPISDQLKVGEILSEADADIELINQRINVLRAQKRGLMHKLLTGDVRVAA